MGGLAGDWPGVDGQPGVCALKVAVEHDRQRALGVVVLPGGGECGALPGGAGLAGGRPGGDHAEESVGFGWCHAGLDQSLPGGGHQFGDELGGGKRPCLVPVPGWPSQPGG